MLGKHSALTDLTVTHTDMIVHLNSTAPHAGGNWSIPSLKSEEVRVKEKVFLKEKLNINSHSGARQQGAQHAQ